MKIFGANHSHSPWSSYLWIAINWWFHPIIANVRWHTPDYLIWLCCVHSAVLINHQIVEMLLLLRQSYKILEGKESCWLSLNFVSDVFLCSVKCQSYKSGIWKPYGRKVSPCYGRLVPNCVKIPTSTKTPPVRCCATSHWDTRYWSTFSIIFSHFVFSWYPLDIKIRWQNKPPTMSGYSTGASVCPVSVILTGLVTQG